MKLTDIKIDSVKVEQGAWVEGIPDLGDLRLKVRGFGNADYRRLQAKLVDQLPRGKKVGGKIDVADMDRIMSLCLQGAILVDWANLTDESGAEIPYSTETAAKIINDPNLRPFRDGIVWAANMVVEDQAAGAKEDAGN